MRRIPSPVTTLPLYITAALVFAATFGGCFNPLGKQTYLEADVNGREFVVKIDGNGQLFPGGRATIVKFEGHELTIEKERILVDGVEKAKIRPETRRFHITYIVNKLTVKQDGNIVYSGTVAGKPEEPEKPATPAAPTPPAAPAA